MTCIKRVQFLKDVNLRKNLSIHLNKLIVGCYWFSFKTCYFVTNNLLASLKNVLNENFSLLNCFEMTIVFVNTER